MPTALVIDDHEIIAFAVQSAVPDWTILYAPDGIAGLDLFRQHAATLDLVVLDLQMPHLDGRAVCVLIRSLRPDLPMLPFTGYPDAAALALFTEFGCAAPLIKPVAPPILAATLRHLIGQPPPVTSPGHGLVAYTQQLVMHQEQLGRASSAPATCIYASNTLTSMGLHTLLLAAGAHVLLQTSHGGTLRQLLDTHTTPVTIVTAAHDLAALLRDLPTDGVPVVCLVHSLPDGLRVMQQRAHRRCPRLGIVVDIPSVQLTAAQSIAAGLDALAQGQEPTPLSLAQPFADLSLTEREQALLVALLLFPSPSDAAAHVGIAPDSIRQYRKRLRFKLGLADDDGLEAWAEAWWRERFFGPAPV